MGMNYWLSVLDIQLGEDLQQGEQPVGTDCGCLTRQVFSVVFLPQGLKLVYGLRRKLERQGRVAHGKALQIALRA